MKTILFLITMIFAGAAYYFYDANTKAQSKLEKAQIELETKIANISNEKNEEIDGLKDTYDAFIEYMKEEIAQGQIKIIQFDDRLSVIMAEKILFPSGDAKITSKGMKVLERVGSVLQTTQSTIIRVEGHTDNEEISKKLQTKYSTNWELSTARATNVVRFLQEMGIEPEFLQPIGMAEYHPIASNATADGRSQNRRIEIALLQ